MAMPSMPLLILKVWAASFSSPVQVTVPPLMVILAPEMVLVPPLMVTSPT